MQLPLTFNLPHAAVANAPDAFDPSALFSSLLPSMQQAPLSPEVLRALLASLQQGASSMQSPVHPLTFPPLVPLPNPIPLQFLPPGTVLVPLCSLPSPSHPSPLLPHPKLSSMSSSIIVHMDVPSSVAGAADSGASTMELSSSPASPASPASEASVGSASSSDSDEGDRRRAKGSKGSGGGGGGSGGSGRGGGGKRVRSSPYSETESDDSSDAHSTDSSDVSASESCKKRRCVVSAQKLPTDTSHLELSMSVVYFQHHSIRIIHTHDRTTATRSTYVHGADVGGVIERKSNISRMFGQFDSPREKVLMNVTGKHNHTVGQEANVLTVEGVRRLMGLKKCQPNAEYQAWLREVLVPRLQEGPLDPQRARESWVEKVDERAMKVGATTEDGQKSPLEVMASVCAEGGGGERGSA